MISWDISLYYSYLPATFIYDDLKIQNEETLQAWQQAGQFYMNEDKQGNRFVKMTCGLAYLYSPFFFLAHGYASFSDSFPADGFSLPYRVGLLASTAFFTLLGLWFLRKVLLRFFSDGAVAITLAVTYLGTNLLYYSIKEPMSHAYNFFLVSLILYLFFRYLDKASLLKALLIGAFSGLLILIRPTDILILIFPLILFIRQEGTQFRSHLPAVVAALIAGILVLLPQLFYWHYMTGKWVMYSYNDERFFFTDPEILKGLFSYRKGWVIYSPALIFAGLGFGFLWFKDRLLTLATGLTFFMALWVTFSWWCWWYGGGFGARPMIDFLPFLGFAFAAVFEKLNIAPRLVKVPVYVVLFALCFFSVFYTKQYKSSIIHYDSMSRELFWKQFMIDHYIQDYEQYLDHPDYDSAKNNTD
ncbi:MAG: hypothetical protein ACPF9D_10005 [Owenweeksia sp.]